METKVVFEDEFGDGLFYVRSKDISLGGLFLESEIPVRVGTMLFLNFALPGRKRPVRVTGEVMRVAGSGVGIRFVGFTEKAKSKIIKFLTKR